MVIHKKVATVASVTHFVSLHGDNMAMVAFVTLVCLQVKLLPAARERYTVRIRVNEATKVRLTKYT